MSVKRVSVKDLELPIVFRDRTLFSPGVHNGLLYTPEAIEFAFRNTIWNEYTQSLYLDHRDNFEYNPLTGEKDKQTDAEVRYYAGWVDNLRLEDGGVIKGDIYVTDLETAIKLKLGAKFGISPRGRAFTEGGKKVKKMYIDNWAIVVNPAQKTTYLNSEEGYYAFAMKEVVSMDEKNEKVSEENTAEMREEEVKENTESEELKENEKTETEELLEKIRALEQEIEELKKKKKKEEEEEYPYPVAEKEGEKVEEQAKKKKDEEKYPELDEELMEFIRGLSDEELSEWKKLVKEHGVMKAKEIYDEMKKSTKMNELEKEVSELKEELKKVKDDLGEPDMIKIEGQSESAELSDYELDRGMLEYFKRIMG